MNQVKPTSELVIFTNQLKSVFGFHDNNAFDTNVRGAFRTFNIQKAPMIVCFCQSLKKLILVPTSSTEK